MAKDAWVNRIVGHGEEKPDQLLANPKNWRVHPKGQQDALAGVLRDVGWVQSIIVNKRTGYVLDGHLRVAMAISHGDQAIPVTYVDLDEAEEAEILATLDPLAALAVADKEQLDGLLREVQSGEAAVQQMLAELAASNQLPYGDTDTERDGQGVGSAWNIAGYQGNVPVRIGDVETRLAHDLGQRLLDHMKAAYTSGGSIHDAFSGVIEAGLETGDS